MQIQIKRRPNHHLWHNFHCAKTELFTKPLWPLITLYELSLNLRPIAASRLEAVGCSRIALKLVADRLQHFRLQLIRRSSNVYTTRPHVN